MQMLNGNKSSEKRKGIYRKNEDQTTKAMINWKSGEYNFIYSWSLNRCQAAINVKDRETRK